VEINSLNVSFVVAGAEQGIDTPSLQQGWEQMVN
jgi:hypothetical protein